MKAYNFTFLEQELINALFRRDFGTASRLRKNTGVNFAGIDNDALCSIINDFSFQGNYQGIYVLEWLGMDFSHINQKFDCENWQLFPPKKGYFRFYRKLINNGVIKIHDFNNIFYDAAICGDRRLLELLLNKGTDINSTIGGGWQGFTPLMMAVKNNHVSCVKFLLENGANIYIKDDAERTTVLQYNLSKEVREVIEEHLKKQKK
jgi:hypothetical protein